MPLQSAVSTAVKRNETKREDLSWMRVNAPEIRAAGSRLAADTGEAPVVLVDRVAREQGLASSLRGTQPSGTGVRVQLEAAPFDTLVAWLAKLDENYGLAIESITVDRAAKPGIVNASIHVHPVAALNPHGLGARFGQWVLIVLGAASAVIVASLPASIIGHLLPPSCRPGISPAASGTVRAGTVAVNSRNAGAVEWRLHPAALLRMTLAADVHWVKAGFVIDGAATVNRRGFTARDITGGGPIEDLHDLGVAADWHGNADVKFSRLGG